MQYVDIGAPVVKLLKTSSHELRQQKAGDIGFDIRSETDITVAPKTHAVVPTDLKLEIPEGLYVMVQGRSGFAFRGVLTHPGLVDTGYRGMIGPILFNLSDDPLVIKKGDRVAQIVFHKQVDVLFERVDALSESERGTTGFGSTGV